MNLEKDIETLGAISKVKLRHANQWAAVALTFLVAYLGALIYSVYLPGKVVIIPTFYAFFGGFLVCIMPAFRYKNQGMIIAQGVRALQGPLETPIVG